MRRTLAGSGRRSSRARALVVLKEVAEALNRASTEGRAAGEALERMADLLGVEAAWVWLRDPVSGRFYNAAVQNLPPYLQAPVRMTGPLVLVPRALLQQRPDRTQYRRCRVQPARGRGAVAGCRRHSRPSLEPGTSHYHLLRAFVDDVTLERATAHLDSLGYRTHEFGDSVLIDRAGVAHDSAWLPPPTWAGRAPAA
jgi:hypothetical protein